MNKRKMREMIEMGTESLYPTIKVFPHGLRAYRLPIENGFLLKKNMKFREKDGYMVSKKTKLELRRIRKTEDGAILEFGAYGHTYITYTIEIEIKEKGSWRSEHVMRN